MAARKPKPSKRSLKQPSVVWAVVLLLAVGGAAGLVYNLLSPRGIYAPAPTRPAPPRQAGVTLPPAPKRSPAVAHAPSPQLASRPAKKPPRPADSLQPTADEPPPTAEESQSTAEEPQAAVEESQPTASVVISLEEAQRIFNQNSAVWVDARSKVSYELGHVPGAMSLPSSDFEAGFALVGAKFPKNVRIVVYCTSADCDESERVITGLVKKGYQYRYLLHFKDGWNEWEMANLPQEQGPGR